MYRCLTVKSVENLDWRAIVGYMMENVASLGSTVGTVATTLSEITLVLILLVFILSEAHGVASRVLAVQQAGGPDLTKLLSSASDIQKYLGIKTVISAIGGLLCGVWCWVLNVDYAALWGIVAFLERDWVTAQK